MIDTFLKQLAPHSCCGCGYVGSILCHSCKNDIVFEPYEQCLSCGRPTTSDNLCAECRLPSGLDGAWVVGPRRAHLKRLLDRYKFDAAKEAASVITELVDGRLPILSRDTVVVAVPTAPTSRRARGFDHTELIAKRFARQRGLAFQRLLSRTSGQSQHFKSRQERLTLTPESLAVAGEVPSSLLLLDDIYTTGATIRACQAKLRQNGARHVYVAIVARQPLDASSDL